MNGRERNPALLMRIAHAYSGGQRRPSQDDGCAIKNVNVGPVSYNGALGTILIGKRETGRKTIMGRGGTSPAAHFLTAHTERFSRIGRFTFINPRYRKSGTHPCPRYILPRKDQSKLFLPGRTRKQRMPSEPEPYQPTS